MYKMTFSRPGVEDLVLHNSCVVAALFMSRVLRFDDAAIYQYLKDANTNGVTTLTNLEWDGVRYNLTITKEGDDDSTTADDRKDSKPATSGRQQESLKRKMATLSID